MFPSKGSDESEAPWFVPNYSVQQAVYRTYDYVTLLNVNDCSYFICKCLNLSALLLFREDTYVCPFCPVELDEDSLVQHCFAYHTSENRLVVSFIMYYKMHILFCCELQDFIINVFDFLCGNIYLPAIISHLKYASHVIQYQFFTYTYRVFSIYQWWPTEPCLVIMCSRLGAARYISWQINNWASVRLLSLDTLPCPASPVCSGCKLCFMTEIYWSSVLSCFHISWSL